MTEAIYNLYVDLGDYALQIEDEAQFDELMKAREELLKMMKLV